MGSAFQTHSQKDLGKPGHKKEVPIYYLFPDLAGIRDQGGRGISQRPLWEDQGVDGNGIEETPLPTSQTSRLGADAFSSLRSYELMRQ